MYTHTETKVTSVTSRDRDLIIGDKVVHSYPDAFHARRAADTVDRHMRTGTPFTISASGVIASRPDHAQREAMGRDRNAVTRR